MCLNGLRCAQNAGKLHSQSTKLQIFLGEHAPNHLVKLVQITHVKSWIHPCHWPPYLRGNTYHLCNVFPR